MSVQGGGAADRGSRLCSPPGRSGEQSVGRPSCHSATLKGWWHSGTRRLFQCHWHSDGTPVALALAPQAGSPNSHVCAERAAPAVSQAAKSDNLPRGRRIVRRYVRYAQVRTVRRSGTQVRTIVESPSRRTAQSRNREGQESSLRTSAIPRASKGRCHVSALAICRRQIRPLMRTDPSTQSSSSLRTSPSARMTDALRPEPVISAYSQSRIHQASTSLRGLQTATAPVSSPVTKTRFPTRHVFSTPPGGE
jgi:hypothetical protein